MPFSVHLYNIIVFSKIAPPSGVKSKAIKELRGKSPRRTKTDMVEPVRQPGVVTAGRTRERRRLAERAATQHTANFIANIFYIASILYWVAVSPRVIRHI